MQLWASACGDWQWMVRHTTLSFAIGWWWSGGFLGSGAYRCPQKSGFFFFLNIQRIFIWNSLRICDVYTNIFKQKSTCIYICFKGETSSSTRGGSRIFIWGGGGKRLCARMHITRAKQEDPYGRVQGPLKSLGSYLGFWCSLVLS